MCGIFSGRMAPPGWRYRRGSLASHKQGLLLVSSAEFCEQSALRFCADRGCNEFQVDLWTWLRAFGRMFSEASSRRSGLKREGHFGPGQ